jgi:hypothetical protein
MISLVCIPLEYTETASVCGCVGEKMAVHVCVDEVTSEEWCLLGCYAVWLL